MPVSKQALRPTAAELSTAALAATKGFDPESRVFNCRCEAPQFRLGRRNSDATDGNPAHLRKSTKFRPRRNYHPIADSGSFNCNIVLFSTVFSHRRRYRCRCRRPRVKIRRCMHGKYPGRSVSDIAQISGWRKYPGAASETVAQFCFILGYNPPPSPAQSIEQNERIPTRQTVHQAPPNFRRWLEPGLCQRRPHLARAPRTERQRGSGYHRADVSAVDVQRSGMMVDKQNQEWRNLTFSQRAGEASLPEHLETGKLSNRFRNGVWHSVGSSLNNSVGRYVTNRELVFAGNNSGKYWETFWFSYCMNILDIPHDMPEHKPKKAYLMMRKIILEGKTHEVLTFIEHMFRVSNIPSVLRNGIDAQFRFAPYCIDRSGEPVCIFPTTSEEMKQHVERSLASINQSELTGTKTHLHNSSQELNNGNYADSVRESIHAVEAAVRQIDPESSNKFGDALDSLEKSGMLKHPALKESFKKLYGYTSDEQGVRHPLIEKESADVGFDEAIFMYGACVSFVDYLVSKQKRLPGKGKENDG